MATKVSIPVENIAYERLDLSRHYLTVDCDFTCFIVLNPSGSIPSEGTDICALHVGAWQIDAWKLLTKDDFPNQAGFSACLVWDKTLVTEGTNRPSVVESDIDTANSVSTLKGQPVNITGFSMPEDMSLPVSLVYGTTDDVISIDNPLFVRDISRKFFRFGSNMVYPLTDFLEIGATLNRSEGDDDIYYCSPSCYYGHFDIGGDFCYAWGNITHLPAGSAATAARYTPIFSYVEMYRNRETGNLRRIAYKGNWFGFNGPSDRYDMLYDLTQLDITAI